MTTTTEDKTQLEQNLLVAARALGEHQFKEIRYARQTAALKDCATRAAVSLQEAEFALAEADAVHATAKLRLLQLARQVQALKDSNLKLYCPTDEARQHLWTISSSTDDQVIIAAAHQYGEAVRAYWTHRQECDRIESEHKSAQETLQIASEARKAAVQKRGKAKAEVDRVAEAERELPRSLFNGGRSTALFDLENAVTEAAYALTGTKGMGYAYSYEYSTDLPIVLPEDTNPEVSEQ
jgi:hypothetical protein